MELPKMPQQQYNHDSTIYSIIYAKNILEEVEVDFSQENILFYRLLIAQFLLSYSDIDEFAVRNEEVALRD
jgi:hypothetical protein